MAIGLENVTSRKTKKVTKAQVPNSSSIRSAAAKTVSTLPSAGEAAPLTKRSRSGARTDFSDSMNEVWLTFGRTYAGREKPNRAVHLCRAWMEFEQEVHRLLLDLVANSSILRNKKGRTLLARPLSLVLERLS